MNVKMSNKIINLKKIIKIISYYGKYFWISKFFFIIWKTQYKLSIKEIIKKLPTPLSYKLVVV